MNKDGTDLEPEDIESILYHGVAEGDIDLKGIRNGQSTFGITKQGEGKVEEMAGGKDVLEATSVFLKALCENGAMGFDIENNVTTFVLIASVLKVVKYYKNWESLLKATQKS